MIATTMPARFFLYGFLCLIFGMVPRASGTTSYSTTFPAAENPISESAKWIDGKAAGMDWASVRTSAGFAYGAQTDTVHNDDSTAILTGTWGADQSAWARVHTVNQSSSLFEEVEIRLRSSISTNSITGYKVSFRCTADGSQYVKIVRWNGPLGNFIYVKAASGPGIHDGDVVKATIDGSTITAYINGVPVVQGTDSTYTSGSPGMGFYIQGGSTSQEADYGFTSFAATDGGSTAQASLALASSSPGTYTTSFPLTENPISDGGNWVGGQSAGGNLWGNIQTTPGFAFGVSEPTQFGDPTAILTGTWSATQSATGTVKINTVPTGTCCHEAEVRLRMTISSNSITGYEVYCSVMPDNPYCHIARWNGPNGSYCNIEQSQPSTFLANGDVLMGTVTGTNPVTITGFKNGVQIMQAQDSGTGCSTGGAAGPWTSGNPGIGFYDNQDFNWNTFGFSSFTASGSLTSQKPNPPTGLTAIVN
jgi:hypothetical protein